MTGSLLGDSLQRMKLLSTRKKFQRREMKKISKRQVDTDYFKKNHCGLPRN